jgi:hypothetical protein
MGTSVIPTLGRWGLTPDADLIYRTLRLLGPDTTPQLAREVGLSAARVGAAVDELVAQLEQRRDLLGELVHAGRVAAGRLRLGAHDGWYYPSAPQTSSTSQVA